MSPDVQLSAYLETRRKLVDAYLGQILTRQNSTPKNLLAAMQYSVLSGGKRLRPILCLSSYQAVGGRGNLALPAACALELLHAFSLVHDDLPCMDNDDLRRGRPTLHKAFGEGMAVLAGDALHTLAFQLLAESNNLPVLKEVATAIGAGGMIGGQVADLEAEGKRIGIKQVQYIHRHKTAALIRASVRIGALLGRASAKELRALTNYGDKLGLAFQIVDDVLNLEGRERDLGKKTGSDRLKDKATYPKAIGIEASKETASRLTGEAKKALREFRNFNRLSQLADHLLQRIR